MDVALRRDREVRVDPEIGRVDPPQPEQVDRVGEALHLRSSERDDGEAVTGGDDALIVEGRPLEDAEVEFEPPGQIDLL